MKQQEKDELIKTIKKYLHVWAENLAPMEGARHHINTGEENPVKQHQYKLGVAKRLVIMLHQYYGLKTTLSVNCAVRMIKF